MSSAMMGGRKKQVERPPIAAPKLSPEHVACKPTTSVRIVELTEYRFRDDSNYTIQEFDYRLRWTLFAENRSITAEGKGAGGHTHATVEVWSRRDAEWHMVWEIGRKPAQPYLPTSWDTKLRNWNALLAELAEVTTRVLL